MPSVISAVPGSTSPDPGGFRAAGTRAVGANGRELIWTGAEWQDSAAVSLVSEAGDYADLSLLAGWALAAAGPGYLFHDGRALLHDGQPLASL